MCKWFVANLILHAGLLSHLVSATRDKISVESERGGAEVNASDAIDDCDHEFVDGECCVWFSSCSCCKSGESEAAMFECWWSARKCAKTLKKIPRIELAGGWPWTKQHPLCYAKPEYLDQHYCQKGPNTDELLHTDERRAKKSVAIPTVSELGYRILNSKGSYLSVSREGYDVGGRIFGVLSESVTKLVVAGAAEVLSRQGGLLLGWLISSMKAIFGTSGGHDINLKDNFDQFEKYMDRKAFQRTLDSIRAKYSVFLGWFKDMDAARDQDVSMPLLQRNERRVDTIEMQLDLAEQEFRHGLPVTDGSAAYYLYEPLFNHAFLHTSVILTHSMYLATLGYVADAKRKLARAKNKHDTYRNQLSEMADLGLTWRLSHVQGHGKPLSSPSLCKSTHKKPMASYPKDTWDIEYSWADTFFPNVKRREKLTLIKMVPNPTSGNTVCYTDGEDTDGRAMLKEAQEYREGLSESLKAHFKRLQQAFDSVWAAMPACVPGFELRRVAADESCKATLSADEVKEHFGALADDASAYWPGQAPIVDPSQYISCSKDNGSIAAESLKPEETDTSKSRCVRQDRDVN